MTATPKAERKRRIAADIAAAEQAAPPGGSAPPPPPPPKFLTDKFKLKDDGVWRERGGDDDDDTRAPLWICSWLQLVAETEDDDGYCGTLWTWRDRSGGKRSEVFPRESFCGEAGDVMRQLAAGGLTFNPRPQGRQGLVEYLTLSSTDFRARVVSRPGWHKISGSLVYVHADGAVCGKAPLQVVLESRARDHVHAQQLGSVAQWRDAVAMRCIGNSRLVLAIGMGFVSPLLYFSGDDGGGLNLVGNSRSGKTTAALCSVSVYGGDANDGGARAAMLTWRQTSNSTEGTAAKRSDKGLVLDELGQVDGREIGVTAYMIASGQGKGRMDRSATLRSPLTWRVLFLSTGEVTLAAKMAETGLGQKVRAGQQIRLLDLPADAGKGMGVFEDIQEAASADAFAQQLKEATRKHFGSAFPVFIDYIVGKIDKNPITFTDYVRSEVQRLASAWMVQAGSDNGQVGTASRRFALIAVACNLATMAGITGWGTTETGETEGEWAARKCFLAWLSERGTVGNFEDAEAIRKLSDFVARHGNARFEYWPSKEPDPADQTENMDAPLKEGRTVMNRAGWRKPVGKSAADPDAQYHYFFTAEGMRDALAGLPFKSSIKMLAEKGFIQAGKVEIAQSLKPPGAGKQRLYVVVPRTISAGIDESLHFDNDAT